MLFRSIGGSIGTAVFSSLTTTAITSYLTAHPTTATITDATIAGDHLVFWAASAVFLSCAVLAALMFRSGPLPIPPGDGRPS